MTTSTSTPTGRHRTLPQDTCRALRTQQQRLRHPDVGELTLAFEVLDLTADQDQKLVAYPTEPNTPSHDSLQLLASLIAAPAHSERNMNDPH